VVVVKVVLRVKLFRDMVLWPLTELEEVLADILANEYQLQQVTHLLLLLGQEGKLTDQP
jgi:hypothetical protein